MATAPINTINGEAWAGPGTPLSQQQLDFITRAYENGNSGQFSQPGWSAAIDQYQRQVKSSPSAPVRPIAGSQATAVNRSSNPAAAAATAPRSAVPDDGTPTQRRLSQIFAGGGQLVQPEPNILDQYSSYTYNISIYLLPSSDYANILSTKTVNLRGSQLLMQSGGAPATESYTAINTAGGTTTTVDAAGRNQFFPLDYYLDNVSVQSVLPGKGTRSAANNIELSFTVTEPNGITLLDNLYRAVDAMVGGNQDPKRRQNYASQHYLMVIRWYGYDENGQLVTAGRTRDSRANTDGSAISEKFIPFIFKNITFKIANQLVEYRCEAVVPQNYGATGQGRGVIPYNIELSAATLGKAFSGSAEVNSVSDPVQNGRQNTPTPGRQAVAAPAKANAVKGPDVVTDGLVDALNKYQQELVQEGIYEIADQYQVVFTDPVLSEAATVPPGQLNKGQVANPAPSTAAGKIFGGKQSAPVDAKKISALAGTTLIQFLDQVIRGSSYIYDQQIKIIDPDTGEEKQIGDPDQRRVVAWYRIGAQVTPIGYDRKRNDHAYRITYQVSPYLINDLQSNYFPDGIFRGYHKAYNYWFTGVNDQVLNYQQDFNYLYYVVINSAAFGNDDRRIDYREQPKRYFQPRSNESDQGHSGRVNEPAANAAERLYSIGDLAKARITIVGDPAWIPQGETWQGVGSFTTDPFLPDGSVNIGAEEPLFAIAFNKPADYDLNTGVADPAGKQVGGGNSLLSITGEASQVYIYRAISVTSSFAKGRFTQDLEGVLVLFPNQRIRYNEDDTIETLRTGSTTEISNQREPRQEQQLTEDDIRAQNVNDRTTKQLKRFETDGPPGISNQGSIDITDYGIGTDIVDQKSPEPPTSNGQELPSTPGAEEPVTFGYTFSIVELRQVDSEFARELSEFESTEFDRIFQQRVEELTNSAETSGRYELPLDTFERNRIETSARNSAENRANTAAVLRYREQLISYGPDVYSDNRQQTTADTDTQTQNQIDATGQPVAPRIAQQITSRES